MAAAVAVFVAARVFKNFGICPFFSFFLFSMVDLIWMGMGI